MTLQVFYDIKEEKRKLRLDDRPDLSKPRPILFWDTSIDKINWRQQQKAIITRVFERGNEMEKKEIVRFYGEEAVEKMPGKINNAVCA